MAPWTTGRPPSTGSSGRSWSTTPTTGLSPTARASSSSAPIPASPPSWRRSGLAPPVEGSYQLLDEPPPPKLPPPPEKPPPPPLLQPPPPPPPKPGPNQPPGPPPRPLLSDLGRIVRRMGNRTAHTPSAARPTVTLTSVPRKK